MPSTILLDRTLWDLCLDLNGNIAVASEPYSIAQDVASAIRLVLGELWYDTTQGVPYFNQILGQKPPISFMKAKFVAAALTVPDVTSATCFITGFVDRTITGQVQVTSSSGQTITVSLGRTFSVDFSPAFD
jgi:hypothetical protein